MDWVNLIPVSLGLLVGVCGVLGFRSVAESDFAERAVANKSVARVLFFGGILVCFFTGAAVLCAYGCVHYLADPFAVETIVSRRGHRNLPEGAYFHLSLAILLGGAFTCLASMLLASAISARRSWKK